MNRQAIMLRAWAIFRENYRYPVIPFKSIGRQCFTWALKEAWGQARDAARIAAIPAAVKAARCEKLAREKALLVYRDDYSVARARQQEIEQELTRLAT